MKSIMQTEKACYLTDRTDNLHKHHIFFGHGNRSISDKNGFWVWLTADRHNMTIDSVHHNKALDLMLKIECQKEYEKTHSREEFMALIGRNYLD